MKGAFMVHRYRLFLLLCTLLLSALPSWAQLTITMTDLDNAFIGKMRVKTHDSTLQTLNLGDGSSNQTWDFSHLNAAALTVRKDTTNYTTPAGHVGASHYPSAKACAFQKSSSPLNHAGDTVLVAES